MHDADARSSPTDASIHKGDVQALIAELGDILAPSTIRIVRQHVGATFARAIDDKLIVVNPAVGVRLPRVETPSVVPLNAEQVQLLLDAADPWYRVAIVIGAGMGLRSSEAAGLTVDRVDFLRRTTRVDRQRQHATQTTAGGFNTTKTRASNRVIPTSQWVLDEIAAHLARRAAGEHGVIVTPNGQLLDAARWELLLPLRPQARLAWPTRSRFMTSGTSPRCRSPRAARSNRRWNMRVPYALAP